MARVSIIVPVYNVAEFLPMCMDSLVNQTLQDIEIICVNDGSTDDSLKILRRYAETDSRIKVIDQNNMGLAGARNTGLSFANGEYIGFVDSDDWVDVNWFEKLYNAASVADADIARAPVVKEFPDGESSAVPFNSVLHDCITSHRDLGINEHFVVVWNGIYRRKMLMDNHINFIFGLVHEDIPFQAKVSFFANKIVPVDGTAYHYRQNRPGQLSETNLKSINGTFYANHYAMDFMNMVKYKNKTDYLDAISRCIWRADFKFIAGVKDIAEFSPDVQRKYFDMWRHDMMMCKYKRKLRRRYKWLRYVMAGRMDTYVRVRLKKDFGHRLLRLLRFKKSGV